MDVKFAAPFKLTLDIYGIETAKAALEMGPAYVLYPGTADTRFVCEAGLELVPVEKGMLFYEVVPRDG